MAFELRRKESLRKGLRRIVQEQLQGALEQAQQLARDEAIHDARKRLKRVRALLQLVRPVVKKSLYNDENASLRDVARPLSELRDAKVLIETIGSVAQDDALASVRQELTARKRSLDERSPLDSAAASIEEALGRVSTWTDVPNRWASVGKGLRRTYRQARRAYMAAVRKPTVEKRHEWRKQAKYLRYQLEILRPLRPEVLEELTTQAEKLGELLGDDHNLAVLRQTLPSVSGHGDHEEVLAVIDRRRAELLQQSCELAERFFRDSPKQFERRIKNYWKKRRRTAKSH
jgi:CHAD domain-containing protein